MFGFFYQDSQYPPNTTNDVFFKEQIKYEENIMCGIAGFYQLQNGTLPENAREYLQTMTRAIDYRGPDGEGLWLSEGIALGHRRLSIIDLTTGAQPMSDAAKNVWITFNGEIYNFTEIRQELIERGVTFRTHSDTEVILYAWLEWGAECVQRFEGMFAFALWDARQKTLFCARDRFGKKPFFYTMQQGYFIFASELTALSLFPHLKLTVRAQSLTRYLAYEYVPTPQCIYEEVHKLPPAHTLLVREGKVQCTRYWDMPTPELHSNSAKYLTTRSEDELAAELREHLNTAVRRRMISDVPLGVFLSGGIDSSIIAGLMAQQAGTIKTFSIGFSEASYDESRYARIVAKHYATDHHERVLSAQDCADILPHVVSRLDEPMADASVAPTYLLSQVTREKVTVALGGDGADELLAGYEHYIAFKLAEQYRKWPTFLRKSIESIAPYLPTSTGYINPRLAVQTFLHSTRVPAWQRIQSLLTALNPDMQATLWQGMPHENKNLLVPERLFAPTREQFAHWSAASEAGPLERAFHVYVRQFLLDDILVKVDRCSMMHSLEVRAPFLDTNVAEFIARLPVHYKLRGFKRKYLLKKACSDLLPKEILTRNKRGFQIPVAQWLRSSLRPLVEDLLGEDFLRNQGLFSVKAVRQLVDAHMNEKTDLRKQLWTLLVLQLWWKKHNPCMV